MSITSQQACDSIIAERFGGKVATDPQMAAGILDIINNLKNSGMSILDIIKYGQIIVSLWTNLHPMVLDVVDRVKLIVQTILDAFGPQPVPPVVKP